jgi:hypothetical protein
MAGRADDEGLAPHSGHEGGPRGLARVLGGIVQPMSGMAMTN